MLASASSQSTFRRKHSIVQAMQRVLGIGGIFFKAQDPKGLQSWYEQHLGLPTDADGYVVFRTAGSGEEAVWAPFAADTAYFAPSTAPFMVNFRVDHLDAMLDQLRAQGVEIQGGPEGTEQGRFAWLLDPEGNKIELWEPARST
jgi:catechol 2,3-dioxygenase-like lactoylglutathione lyase family enzyme